jgi:hypothetical protein
MLSDLPLEILRRICTYLSPESALSFAHSCRHTYQACDDWIVWRQIVKGSARVRIEPAAAVLEQGRKGKRYTMADARVVRSGNVVCGRPPIEQCMPQLMVLGCRRCNCHTT